MLSASVKFQSRLTRNLQKGEQVDQITALAHDEKAGPENIKVLMGRRPKNSFG